MLRIVQGSCGAIPIPSEFADSLQIPCPLNARIIPRE